MTNIPEDRVPHPVILGAMLSRLEAADAAFSNLNEAALLELPYARHLIAMLAASNHCQTTGAVFDPAWEVEFLIREALTNALTAARKSARILIEQGEHAQRVDGIVKATALDQFRSDTAARDAIIGAAVLGILTMAKHLESETSAASETPQAA